ncbi:hypothetical protein Glove_1032g5 [Diversispora epigaea]|uniref:NADH-ubiquinone oxidoreductase chain 2 n=1 Tax=Diversispora epigaea TaxID=1348612 RepID=A0A397FXT0_9GLOM|nr:hypothetical protein Glove_1032g5 [Diversispora epigaea]
MRLVYKSPVSLMVKIAISYVVYISSSLIPGSPYMLILSIILILLSNAVNLRRDMAILYNRISLVSLFYCGLISYTTINIIITALILVLTAFYPAKIKILHNTINLAIELQSYGLYILSTIYRNSELSTTGGLIYFLLGGLSSCFILLGTALLYSNTGTVVALGISTVESTQAFIFYLTQYTISNLNAFIILLAIGYTLYYYTVENKEHQKLLEKNNSPVQLINQLKGIPPLVGFFAKQMVLSAALDSGLVFLALVAILTSVIGGIYYLTIIKEMFFSLPDNIESKIEEKNFSILDIDNKTYTIQHND